jgi:RHS repeat-associated protein
MRPLSSAPPRSLRLAHLRRLLALLLVGGLGALLLFALASRQRREVHLGQAVSYDDDGQVAEVTDAAGRTTRFTMSQPDAQGRRQRVRVLPDGSKVIEVLDKFGRRLSMKDTTGTVAYEYDGFNRLTGARRDGAPALACSYDSLGRTKTVKVGESFAVGYRYDFLGRRTEIQTPVGVFSTEFRRDSDGLPMVVQRFPGEVRSERRTNKEGRLSSLTHVAANGRILARFTYDYRPDGLISRVREEWQRDTVVRTYLYDNVQRLASVVDSRHGTHSYHYDLVGNRTEVLVDGQAPVVSRFDWAGRLVQHGGTSCAHDAAGNLTGWTADRRARCSFTAAGALAEVDGPERVVRYVHDGDGQLVRRELGSTETTFTPDPIASIWRPLAAVEGDRQTFFVWDEKAPLAAVTGKEVELYLSDHLGSVRLAVSARGKVVRRLDYDPFGSPHEQPAGSGLQPGFAGLFFDPDAGLYLTRARAYRPDLGRFLQPDPEHRIPFGSQKDLSSYAYCGADPVNFVDRDGANPEANTGALPPNCDGAIPLLLSAAGLATVEVPPLALTLEAANALNSAYCSGREFRNGQYVRGTLDAVSAVLPGAREAGKAALIAQMDTRITEGTLGQATRNLATFNRWTNRYENLRTGYDTAEYGYTGLVGEGSGRSESPRPQAPSYSIPFMLDRLGASSSTPPPAAPAYNLPQSTIRDWTNGAYNNPFQLPELRSAREDARQAEIERRRLEGQMGYRNDVSWGSPQRLGGISFRGIGAALKELGPLQGVAVDGNGRLVLVAADQKDVKLPPLRLEDVAVIFRAAYRQGQAPFVSIDPDPNNPHAPHRIRHSPGTEQTYVGWVLFEVDRLMKVYGIGRDNYGAREPIHLSIPGYKSIPQRSFENRTAEGKSTDKRDLWVRKWIVPASVTRRQASLDRLTLLDVPLKVNLVTEVRADGKFTELADTKPPRSEQDYALWFAEHIDDMAREVRSMPPAESGMTEPVPVFLELRRIALISAIAEQLRDQGVPLPRWIRDYPIKPFRMPTTMPEAANKVVFTTGGGTLTFSPYGGAVMSPPIDQIRSEPSAEAGRMAQPLLAAVAPVPSFQPVSFLHEGKTHRAVALPGDDTQGLGACALNETDLAVPLSAGIEVRLERHYHSFHLPADVFGAAWTLDLPRMEVFKRIRRQEGKTRHFQHLLQLDSPLGTWCDFFARQEKVVLPGSSSVVELAAPRKPGDMLGARVVVDKDDPSNNGLPVLYFRDGRRWSFDKDGYLARKEEAPATIVYRRDVNHRVTCIEGTLGTTVRARIDLTYDAQGRLSEAIGSNGARVSYHYGADGLAEARRPDGAVGYRYRDGLVTHVLRDGTTIRQFECTPQGVLRSESLGDGTKLLRQVFSTPEGAQLTTAPVNRPTEKHVVVYDRQFRPLKQLAPDGGRMEWKYGDGGDVSLTITPAGSEPATVQRSADGRKQTWRLPTGATVRTDYDSAGRPQTLSLGNADYLRLDYRPDGQVKSIVGETFVLRPAYGEDGVQKATQFLSPEVAEGKRGPWLQVDYNAQGRPTRLTDSQGGNFQVRYDAQRRLESMMLPQGETRLRHDEKGRLTALEAPGGLRRENTFDPDSGQLQRIRATRGGATEEMELDRGLLVGARKFDLGQTRYDYEEVEGDGRRLRRIQVANGLELSYEYDAQGRLAAVNCGSAYRLEYNHDEAGRLVRWQMVPRRGGRGLWR